MHELLTELICGGSDPSSNVLHSMRLQVARMGMLADALAANLSGRGWADVRGGAAAWMLADGTDELHQAWQAIQAECRQAAQPTVQI